MNKFTEKDLSYISDMFDWNLQTLKLAKHFMDEAKQDEIKEILEEIVGMHYANLDRCVSILNGEFEEYDDDLEEGCSFDDEEEEDEEDE